jgi:NTP pyrophosphatase (non-canonical NTP hydrolase)
MTTIAELSKEIYSNAVNKGFYDKPVDLGTRLMLIVSEASEALEADRANKYADLTGRFKEDSENYLGESDWWFERFVKNSFEDELADIIIRVLDLSVHLDVDIEWHIKRKMKYNSTRPHMHGKKY